MFGYQHFDYVRNTLNCLLWVGVGGGGGHRNMTSSKLDNYININSVR